MDMKRLAEFACEVDCEALTRQGREVLEALGERRLAREFCHRAVSATDRESVIMMLLDCIVARQPEEHPGGSFFRLH